MQLIKWHQIWLPSPSWRPEPEKRMSLWLEAVNTFCCLFLVICVFGNSIYAKGGTQFPALLWSHTGWFLCHCPWSMFIDKQHTSHLIWKLLYHSIWFLRALIVWTICNTCRFYAHLHWLIIFCKCKKITFNGYFLTCQIKEKFAYILRYVRGVS